MIKSVKGRYLGIGQAVEIYYNLHRKCFSVRDAKTKLVVAHTDTFFLAMGEAKVSEAGRQRVLKEGRKNVHAYLVGIWAGEAVNLEGAVKVPIQYNPYKQATFIETETGKAVTKGFYFVGFSKKEIVYAPYAENA